MFENVKSKYIIAIFFSFLNEGKKLKIIKNNKGLQNKLGINIMNYIRLSGRFISYETKAKVKEYCFYKDVILFEGEYLNGKRNGKGKEYNIQNELIFEGEYLNGKRWNGKEYDKLGNNIYYEFKNGKGFIKENHFNFNKYLIFEGEYSNGERNGKGKEYYSGEKIKFEGEYLNNKRWNGKGYDNNNKVIYELKDGKGYVKEMEYNKGKLVFEGEYLNGERNGKGKEYDYLLRKIFEGEYLNGKRHGKGKEYHGNYLIFEGRYLYNYRIEGKEYIKGKLAFEGEYLFDKKWNGKGYDENGNIIYELINGNGKIKEYYYEEFDDYKKHYNRYNYEDYLVFEGKYLNGKKNGEGKEYKNDKLIFEGNYLNGERNGKRKEYNEYGNIIFEGEYFKGKRWNGKGEELNYSNMTSFHGEYRDGKFWNGKMTIHTGVYKLKSEFRNGEKINFY